MTSKLKLLIIIASSIVGALIVTIATLLIVKSLDVDKVKTLSFDGPNKQVLVDHELTLTVSTSPDSAKNKKVNFSITDDSIASILSVTDNSVTISAHRVGQVVLKATSAGNRKIKDECIINVVDVLIQEISFEQSNYASFVGETIQIPLIVTPFDANNSSIVVESFDKDQIESVTLKSDVDGTVFLEVVSKAAGVSEIAVSVCIQTNDGQANILTRTVVVESTQATVEELSIQMVSAARYYTGIWVSKASHSNVLLINGNYSAYFRVFAAFESVLSTQDVTNLVSIEYDETKLEILNADSTTDKKFQVQSKSGFTFGKTVIQINFQSQTETIEVIFFDPNLFNNFEVSLDPVQTFSTYQLQMNEISYPRFVFKKNTSVISSVDAGFVFDYLFNISVSTNNSNVNASRSQVVGVSTGSSVVRFVLNYKYWDTTFSAMVSYQHDVSISIVPDASTDFYFEKDSIRTSSLTLTSELPSASVRVVYAPIGSIPASQIVLSTVKSNGEVVTSPFGVTISNSIITITYSGSFDANELFELVFVMGGVQKTLYVQIEGTI